MIKLKSILTEEKEAFRLERNGDIEFNIDKYVTAHDQHQIDISIHIKDQESYEIGIIKLLDSAPAEDLGNAYPKPNYLFIDYIGVQRKGEGFGYLLYKEALKYCQRNKFKGLVSNHARSPDADRMWGKLKTFTVGPYDYVDIRDLGTRLKENEI